MLLIVKLKENKRRKSSGQRDNNRRNSRYSGNRTNESINTSIMKKKYLYIFIRSGRENAEEIPEEIKKILEKRKQHINCKWKS